MESEDVENTNENINNSKIEHKHKITTINNLLTTCVEDLLQFEKEDVEIFYGNVVKYLKRNHKEIEKYKNGYLHDIKQISLELEQIKKEIGEEQLEILTNTKNENLIEKYKFLKLQHEKYKSKKEEILDRNINMLKEIERIKTFLVKVENNEEDLISEEHSLTLLEQSNKIKKNLTKYQRLFNDQEDMRVYFLDEIKKVSIQINEEIDMNKLCTLHIIDLDQVLLKKQNEYKWLITKIEKKKADIEKYTKILEFVKISVDCKNDQKAKNVLEKLETYNQILKTIEEKIDIKQINDKLNQQIEHVLHKIKARIGVTLNFHKQNSDLLIDLDQKISSYTDLLTTYDKIKVFQTLMNKRRDLVHAITQFNSLASDPKRLKGSSLQLFKEEKFRRTAYPTLKRLDKELHKFIMSITNKSKMFFWKL